ncbi:hypothetical protein F5Y18DRAFT_131729 [Xylariaceae sp. FL1019]|nr:hypothetical protein F5Y18DRAFT_131729 [Xylariaceae sp. FL1019]
MSEHWKSTPKYWCKHCSTFVRDTKLERKNHELTAKHQSALKRFLRELHRGHENEEREKERAKREIDRLNGIKPTYPSGAGPSKASGLSSSSQTATTAQRHAQWEQLADMGIDVPTELRGDMAMAGEWTVTNTRIIKDAPETDDADTKDGNVDAVAIGVRKRAKPEDEDEKDEEEEKAAVQGLFKKPKKWGRDTRGAPANDAELDALLSTPLSRPSKKEEEEVKTEPKEEPVDGIKKEEPEGADSQSLSNIANAQDVPANAASIKQEHGPEPEAPAVVFKKRKPKNIRQK